MPPSLAPSSIVLAHDYFTQKGGAERVALALAQGLSVDRIVTSITNPSSTFDAIRDFPVTQSLLSKFNVFREDPRRALPFLALTWSAFKPIHSDILICSSTGWAHGLRVRKGTLKVVYCHNPARWLYQADEYLLAQGLLARLALLLLTPLLRAWDKRAARSADIYIANSTTVQRRVRQAYGISAKLVFPPISIDLSCRRQPVNGVEQPFFVTVGRNRGYKGTRLLERAFEQMPDKTLVIAGGTSKPDFSSVSNVMHVGRVSESQLCWLYENAEALVSVSQEDFGLTPLEANAFGTPSLVLRAGGFLDSTDPSVSGTFIDNTELETVVRAVREFPCNWNKESIKAHAAKFSKEAFLDAIREVVNAGQRAL